MASVTPRRNSSGTVIWRVQYRIAGRPTQDSFQDEDAARTFGRLIDRVGGEAARAVRIARNSSAPDVPTLQEWTAAYLDPERGYLAESPQELGTGTGPSPSGPSC